MAPTAALLLGLLTASASCDEEALLAAVPDDAYALLHLADPPGLRARAEQNDWISLVASHEGESARSSLEHAYEEATGTDLEGLLGVALALHGEALLFLTPEVAGFLTVPPPDRAALAGVLDGWLVDTSRRSLELGGARLQVAPWPATSGGPPGRAGHVLAFLDHPRVLGLVSGDSEEALLATLTASLAALQAGAHRAPVVEGFLAAGGRTTGGLEAFVDFTPFVARAEESLRDAVEGVLPDPTGLLGLEAGTWLFATADVGAGTRAELRARLRIPPDTLAARLADSFEPLPGTLPADLPRGAWLAYAFDWNLGRFYDAARAGLEQREGQGLVVVDQGLAAAEALAGVDPIEDVIRQLSGWFALYHVLDAEGAPVEGEEGFGLLAGLVDGDRFLRACESALGGQGLGIEPVELEGARTFLLGGDGAAAGDAQELAPDGGGLAVLPQRLSFSMGRETLVRGLRALGGAEGASLAWGSGLQAALDENSGASAFAHLELAHVRALVLGEARGRDPEGSDPFGSQLVLAIRRTPEGFDARLYTR